ncbi:hypothetical protein OROGR_031519 [Orobanche gracilis]
MYRSIPCIVDRILLIDIVDAPLPAVLVFLLDGGRRRRRKEEKDEWAVEREK